MRNFLYNKSDVLVAAIIVIVAVIIIWSRIGAIMNSSASAKGDTAKTATTSDTTNTTDNITPADDGTVQPATDANTNANANAGTAPPDTTAQTNTPAAGDIVKFKVKSGMSSGDIANALKEKGLIASVEEFNSAVDAKNASGILRTGSFNIPAGSSVDKIIDILTGNA